MKEYKVTLEFTVSIVDVEKQRKKEESELKRQEAVEIQQKRLAGIEAARKKSAAEEAEKANKP